MIFLQALTIGFFGSFHCIGMCGPIALALPLKGGSGGARFLTALLYNLGRILTYFILGLVFGLIGSGLNLWGFQRWVSIILGAVMIIGVLFPFLVRSSDLESGIDRLLSGFKSFFARFFGYRSTFSALIIGLLNGFLPCGLVYIALAGALVSSTPVEGGTCMLFFGLGTIPALLAVTFAGNLFGMKFRNRIKKLIPILIIAIGVLFILRGLNLGIPYLSPEMNPELHRPACCH
ncbi:MAG: sulfite exporter TauE/SafE family protein [Bacteroidetes bacterium]|nr:sulfite exporter TauE/SafE family protein [Bacteroidota bacterium]